MLHIISTHNYSILCLLDIGQTWYGTTLIRISTLIDLIYYLHQINGTKWISRSPRITFHETLEHTTNILVIAPHPCIDWVWMALRTVETYGVKMFGDESELSTYFWIGFIFIGKSVQADTITNIDYTLFTTSFIWIVSFHCRVLWETVSIKPWLSKFCPEGRM